MLDWFGHWFHTQIIDSGKLPLFMLLLGLIVTFLIIRLNTRLERHSGRGFLGSVRHGDLHIHHVAFGVPALVVAGILEFALDPGAPWSEMLAATFGVGAGLTLDEFALVLHVEDVYWEDAGRKSIDAVILGITFIGLLMLGWVPLGLPEGTQGVVISRWVVALLIAGNSVFVIITFLKGKIWTGALGVFVPVFAWVGAVRLARINSPWARRWYRDKPATLARARRRDERHHRSWGRAKRRLWDIIGGAPSKPPA